LRRSAVAYSRNLEGFVRQRRYRPHDAHQHGRNIGDFPRQCVKAPAGISFRQLRPARLHRRGRHHYDSDGRIPSRKMGNPRLRHLRLALISQPPAQVWGLTRIGFVFLYPAGRIIAITSFQINTYANLSLPKLALFFQLGLSTPGVNLGAK
jgi:hypothetical protein